VVTEDELCAKLALGNEDASAICIVIDKRPVRKRQIEITHIDDTSRIPPDDRFRGNAVTTLADTSRDASDGSDKPRAISSAFTNSDTSNVLVR
jgi:hypothetical protein